VVCARPAPWTSTRSRSTRCAEARRRASTRRATTAGCASARALTLTCRAGPSLATLDAVSEVAVRRPRRPAHVAAAPVSGERDDAIADAIAALVSDVPIRSLAIAIGYITVTGIHSRDAAGRASIQLARPTFMVPSATREPTRSVHRNLRQSGSCVRSRIRSPRKFRAATKLDLPNRGAVSWFE